jgi:hypothetical protein
MRRVGYDLVYLQLPSILSTKGLDTKAAKEFCAQPVPKTTELKLKEGNALWKRKGAADRDFAFQNS